MTVSRNAEVVTCKQQTSKTSNKEEDSEKEKLMKQRNLEVQSMLKIFVT